MDERTIPGRVLFRVLVRSFLLQASWNFERLQNLGVLFVLEPALRFLYRGDDLTQAFHRHFEYFNTHPVMASPILGTTLALENDPAATAGRFDVREFKGMIMAPYAAMGDSFFWGGIRPLAACVALFVAVKGSLWEVGVFLLLFNLPHLWFRVAGLLRGYALGLRAVEVVQAQRLPDLALRLKESTVVLLGGLCAYLTFLTLRGQNVAIGWGVLVLPVVGLLGWAAHRRVSVLLLALLVAGALLAIPQIA